MGSRIIVKYPIKIILSVLYFSVFCFRIHWNSYSTDFCRSFPTDVLSFTRTWIQPTNHCNLAISKLNSVSYFWWYQYCNFGNKIFFSSLFLSFSFFSIMRKFLIVLFSPKIPMALRNNWLISQFIYLLPAFKHDLSQCPFSLLKP